jgi:hypothetical protein
MFMRLCECICVRVGYEWSHSLFCFTFHNLFILFPSITSFSPNRKVVAIFSKCLAVSREEAKRSSLLRSTADNTLAHVVLVVFSRARLVNHHHHQNAKKGSSGSTGNNHHDRQIEDMEAQVKVEANGDDDDEDDDVAWPGSDNETPHAGGGDNSCEHSTGGSSCGGIHGSSSSTGAATSSGAGVSGSSGTASSSSLPATVAIMQALSSLCNPRATLKPPQAQGGGFGGVGGNHSTNKKKTNNEESVAIALSLVNVAIEAGGEHLGKCPQLVEVMQVGKMPSLLLCSCVWFLALTLVVSSTSLIALARRHSRASYLHYFFS